VAELNDRQAYLDGKLCGIGPDGITSFNIVRSLPTAAMRRPWFRPARQKILPRARLEKTGWESRAREARKSGRTTSDVRI
jgi:hypothetical protein